MSEIGKCCARGKGVCCVKESREGLKGLSCGLEKGWLCGDGRKRRREKGMGSQGRSMKKGWGRLLTAAVAGSRGGGKDKGCSRWRRHLVAVMMVFGDGGGAGK
ncbi:hypothetical protein RIF29_10601 [Crotalaria pallida]|uniref:Uncharacterized protein n=1 Tax=Crotalaria pallida TaxID=3830 RepID=A0AAN9FVX0_CROPI